MINQSIFKSYDVRGIYPSELNEGAAFAIGRAFVKKTGAKRVVVGLDARLSSVLADGNPSDRVGRLAQAYLSFTHEKPRLWNLLFEHHMPAKAQLPPWYQQKLEGLMGRVEEAIAPLFPVGQEAARQRAARVLWAGVHGITSLSTADKLSVVTTETASRLVADLVATYLVGLAAGAASRPAA